MASSIKTVLDLDISKFKSSAGEAVAVAGKTIGAGLGQAIDRKVGMKDAFKGLVAGIGISVETIAEKLTEGFKQASESAERILQSTTETLGIYDRIFSGRRTDDQNLLENRRRQKRLQDELETSKPRVVEKKQFNAFTQRFDTQQTTIPGNSERAAEIAKELASLAEQEQELTKKTAETKRKDLDDYLKKSKELDDILERNARAQLDTQGQIDALLEKQNALRNASGGLAAGELETQIEIAKIDAQILDLRERQGDEFKKQADDTIRQLDKIDELRRKAKQAVGDVRTADMRLSSGRRDQVAFGLEEAAGGTRGSRDDLVRARRIQSLELRARRAYDSRGEFRDERGQVLTGEQRSRQLMDRANQLRTGFDRLKSNEQDPMGALLKEQKTASEHLKEIRDSLAVASVGNEGY